MLICKYTKIRMKIAIFHDNKKKKERKKHFYFQ